MDASLETSSRLIHTITYLSKLASEARAIDKELDILRVITAQAKGAPLNADQEAALRQVEHNLRDYLINRDPLRKFTPETLEQRLQEEALQAEQARPAGFSLTFGWAVFISLLCAAPAIFLSAATSLWDGVFVAVPFFLVLTTAFNCWFYLSSMRHFRPELKRAFVYLCVGTVGIGVIFVQYVSIALFNQDQRPLFRYGGLPIIATFAVAVMYVGLRRYARLLGLGSRFDSGGRLIVALCAGLIAAAAVAYVREVPDKWYFGLSIASLVLLTVLSAWAAGLAYAIMRSVTAAYAVSMRRIFLFAVGVCVAAPIFATLITVRGELYGDALNVALAICAIPPMLLLLHSGASFKKETAK